MPKKITKETVASPFEEMFKASFEGMTPKQPEETGAEDPSKKPTRKTAKKPAEKPQKPTGRVFSVWMQEDTIEQLKAYTEATGRKKTDVLTAAVTEYLNRHKLTTEQKTAYQKKQKNLQAITKNL